MYSIGPTAVALTMQGPWVVGALINNQWSFAGWDEEGRELDAAPAVRELQFRPRLGGDELAHRDGGLESQQCQQVDRADWRRPEQAVQSGAAADQHIGAGLLQRGEAPVRRGLAAALPGPVPPSQLQVGPLACDLGPMPVRSPSSLHCPVEGVT